jgi:hypothetical protein
VSITLTRRQARGLRGIFRRSVLGISHRGIIPPLVLQAEGTGLRAHHRYAKVLAVEHALPGAFPAGETIALPLDALTDFEGRSDSPVILEAAASDLTVARWEDRGIPQSREYTIPDLAMPELPGLPGSWVDMPGTLLDALAEAGKTGTDSSTRYALNCIQLRGDRQEIVATDGHQLLVWGGFPFPWTGDVLIRHLPIFASRELPRDQVLSIGKTETHVVFRVGPWTLFSEIQEGVRFPRIDDTIPAAQGTATRLCLDAGDAGFLGPALERLPGSGELYSPVTLDCNGRIAIRARGTDQTRSTELVLSRSRYTGRPVRFHTNRTFLARAVQLGFGALEIVDADTPVVCRAGNRVFAWQPLSKEGSFEPTNDVILIESASQVTTPAIPADVPPVPVRNTVSQTTRPTRATIPKNGHAPASDHVPSNGTTNGHTTPESPVPITLASLVQEAEALHAALSDARARAGRLTMALRKYRKRERLMASALESIKQLKLQEVAG